jgi:hypothetical protein
LTDCMQLGHRIPRYPPTLPYRTDAAATVQEAAQLHMVRAPSLVCGLGRVLPTCEGVWKKRLPLGPPAKLHFQQPLTECPAPSYPKTRERCHNFTRCHPLSAVPSPGTLRKSNGHHEYTIRAMWSHNGPNAATMSGTRCSRARKRAFVAASCSPIFSTHHRLKPRIQQDA